MRKLLDQARAFPDLTHSDFISNYCRSSPECEEVLKLLEGRRKISEVNLYFPSNPCLSFAKTEKKPFHKNSFSLSLLQTHLIFEVLECILLRLSQDLVKFRSVGQHITRRILGGYVPLIYALLAMKNKSSQIKSALKLLTAMIIQGPSSAKEVQSQLNFSHPCFYPLLSRKDTKVPFICQEQELHLILVSFRVFFFSFIFVPDFCNCKKSGTVLQCESPFFSQDEQDVRTCMLQFMMSFLIVGDDSLIKETVDAKGIRRKLDRSKPEVSPGKAVLETFQKKNVALVPDLA